MDLNLPTPNIPLLRKAVEWAEAEDSKTDGTCMWNQQSWATETDCGTAYCIAGYTIAVAHPSAHILPGIGRGSGDLLVDGRYASWEEAAAEILGIGPEDAAALFWALNSIADVREIAEVIAARAGERL